MNIPEQLTVPSMPSRDEHEDVTIDSMIKIFQLIKSKGVSGNELILFRDFGSQELFMPTYPVVTLEESFDPITGEKVCHRVIVECRIKC